MKLRTVTFVSNIFYSSKRKCRIVEDGRAVVYIQCPTDNYSIAERNRKKGRVYSVISFKISDILLTRFDLSSHLPNTIFHTHYSY